MSFPVARSTKDWALNKKISLQFLESVPSTNSWAKEDSSSELYLTENQTGGRGRNQNQWLASSPEGQLFSSWVFKLKTAPQPIMAPLAGLALWKALQANFGDRFALKAPNDIYMDDKKIAGILMETLQMGSDQWRLIIGIGLNVFSKPSLPSAGSLVDKISATEIERTWNGFLDQLFKELSLITGKISKTLSSEQRQDLLQALNQFSLLPEKYEAVLEDGSLQMKTKLIHWSDL